MSPYIKNENKTIQELIAEPNCDQECPPCMMRKEQPVCCCSCHQGYYEEGEIEERVKLNIITQEEADWLRELIENNTFFAGNGCRVERRLRSRFCMEWTCK